MKSKLTFWAALALMAFNACTGDLKQNENGVTVKVQQPVEGGPSLVRLEVLGDKIIHVSATPEQKFADKEGFYEILSRN